MAIELCLNFPDAGHVSVELMGAGRPERTAPLPFTSPITEPDQDELHWYLEVYPTHYATELDDRRAAAIARRLEGWGRGLFDAVFGASYAAAGLFARFAAQAEPGRLLAIDSGHPAVLAQPWELLRHPEGAWLFLAKPRIGVCRRLSGQGAATPVPVAPKDRLHLLFVVSRPTGAPFIDPRTDPQAVMAALQTQAPGRVTVEFLRPPTLAGLLDRLEDESAPAVDILHFDGHGVYDPDGHLGERAAGAIPERLRAALHRAGTGAGDGASAAHQGYLLFEQEDGSEHLVPATLLGDLLNEQQVPLAILSACQSAKLGGDDPLGSVAARLTRAGIPNVLAMTHSVLVDTTRALFGHLYRELGRGRPLGTALENARRELYLHQGRGERRRADGWIELQLQDWFLPALYRTGDDSALLTLAAPADPDSDRPADPAPPPATHNLPEPQPAGFWGRSGELWEIECAFVRGTRRLVVTGFGGQGKTYLAQEAGRWLLATGLFQRVCFVSFADFQGVDPVGWATSRLSDVLDQSLLDEQAAAAALARVPTLLILDNLESLIEPPGLQPGSGRPERSRLDALLAAARSWSEAGASRCLITTRTPDLAHPGFPTDGDRRCRYLTLAGLAPRDAFDWYQSILRQSAAPHAAPAPGRDALVALFRRVEFHPLSIGLLAETLKHAPIDRVADRLAALLAAGDGPLVAALNLSLERLDPGSAALLPRLGVFRGGTFEDGPLAVTEIEPGPWSDLKSGLVATGLIQVEPVPGVDPPYLRFHPTLAPALWVRLGPDEQARLGERFRDWHSRLADYLYQQDVKNVHATRAIARLVLPNLMAAVHQSLDSGAPGVVRFVSRLRRFLDAFGLTRDSAELNARAQSLAGVRGSHDWYLARIGQGEALFQAGRLADAALVFEDLLAGLPESPSYRRCLTLHTLGRCRQRQRRAAEAESALRQAIVEAGMLEPGDQVKRELGYLYTELGDVLADQGDYAEARAAYESGLRIARGLGDLRGAAVPEGQLGTLAYRQGGLTEAERRYREALSAFQRLREPPVEAVIWHQLGMVYADAGHWEPAERAYRSSAEIKESRGDGAGAAQTWDQLAQMIDASGRPQEAEGWYRKALAVRRQSADPGELAITLNNLADLLRGLPGQLDEARALAEECLALRKTLDPAAAEIWQTYQILAAIAESQGDRQSAARYRRDERAAFSGFVGSRRALGRFGTLIAAVLETVARPEQRAALEQVLEPMILHGWGNLVAAIRRILDGGRDADALCEPLDREDALIVQTILEGLRDPDSVRDLTEPQDPADRDRPDGAPDARALLARHAHLILAVHAAAAEPLMREQLTAPLKGLTEHGWGGLVGAIERLLAGERDPATLCTGLDAEDALIVQAILAGLADPQAIAALLSPGTDPAGA